jgi:predicted metalloprotease
MRRLSRPLIVCVLLLAACSSADLSPTPIPLSAPRKDGAPASIPPSPSPATSQLLTVPLGHAAAVDSPLYAAPRVKASCKIPAIRSGNWPSMKKYMTSVSTCLDQIWAGSFKEARIFFKPPKRKFVQRRVRDPECGMMPAKGADGTYCGATTSYYVLVPKYSLRPWAATWVSEVIAHEYGHHVQYWANILDHEEAAAGAARTRSAADLLSRRLELQAECFAGLAVSAMRRQMPPWRQYRDLYWGTLDGAWVRDHGRLSTQLKWLEKGYRSGKPGACDTWSGPKSEVS